MVTTTQRRNNARPKSSGPSFTASSLASLTEKQRQKYLQSLSPEELEFLSTHWRFWARQEQLAPAGDWTNWLVLGGRGLGKTRTGAEFVRDEVTSGRARKIALIGATNADVRDIMIQGDADAPGLLDVFPRHQRPLYIPSRRLVQFHNGARGYTYSAEKPARLRGPQHDLGWLDELAAYEEAGKGRMRRVWDMFKFGLRRGPHPRCLITTTPKPLPLIKELVKDPATAVTRGSMLANAANLAPNFLRDMLRLYGGTRIGKQELEGLILEEVEGALWMLATIEAHRVRPDNVPEDLARIIVGVDPSVAGKDFDVDDGRPAKERRKRDTCGIVVAGRQGPRKPFAPRFVLADYSLNAPPPVWAVEVVRAYWLHNADCVAAEANNGGDLVRMAIHGVDPRVNVKLVNATRGKYTRAEPVAMAYSRGEVHHVGAMPLLEDEMTTWVPDGSAFSPGRIDALVWAIMEDMEGVISGAHAA